MKLTELVASLAAEPAQAAGCFVWDVEFVKEGGERYLRVSIDNDAAQVDIDQCEAGPHPGALYPGGLLRRGGAGVEAAGGLRPLPGESRHREAVQRPGGAEGMARGPGGLGGWGRGAGGRHPLPEERSGAGPSARDLLNRKDK